MTDSAFRIERLNSDHDRSSFACGSSALDTYLKTQAGQDARKKVSVVYVAVGPAAAGVAGYYTISSSVVELRTLPEDLRKKSPLYEFLPATLLGRLAVSQSYRGTGLGKQLLIAALRVAYNGSLSIASAFVMVEAKDQAAMNFYQKYGFTSFPSDPLKLFMKMSTLAQIA